MFLDHVVDKTVNSRFGKPFSRVPLFSDINIRQQDGTKVLPWVGMPIDDIIHKEKYKYHRRTKRDILSEELGALLRTTLTGGYFSTVPTYVVEEFLYEYGVPNTRYERTCPRCGANLFSKQGTLCVKCNAELRINKVKKKLFEKTRPITLSLPWVDYFVDIRKGKRTVVRAIDRGNLLRKI